MEQASNTLWITGFTADGFKISLTLGLDATEETIGALMQKAVMAKSAGLMATLPGLKPGQEKEVIDTVVRRVASDGTPIIDFYPQWGYQGEFGVHKYAHLYLDNAEDVAQFEMQSGLKLSDIPLYESATALHRVYGKAQRFETPTKRTFEIVRTADGTHPNGMPKYIYSYFKPLPPAPVATPEPKPVTPAPESKSLSPKPEVAKVDATTLPVYLQKDGALNVTEFWKMVHEQGMTPAEVLKRMGVKQITEKPAEVVWRMWTDITASGGKPAQSPLD